MCGIFGTIGKIDRNAAENCIKKIKHRGPDALGIQELQGATLAHARLSILDTSDAANQPFCSLDKRYWIIFNGEIYNFVEIRYELEETGYKFRTHSDTEVALYAYLEWGEKFQKKCNGMWALAIWDDYEKRLFLSRDRYGVKPLYWYEYHNNFYFASEIKALLPILKEIRPEYDLFANGYNPFASASMEKCAVKGVNQFLPGCCATYSNEKLKITRWWNTLDNLITVPTKYEEQVEYLRDIFMDAVKIRMRSDVPIGTALSGGIDSSTIISFMHNIPADEKGNHFCDDWHHAVTVSMPNTLNDETVYARLAADYIGLEVNCAEITPPVSLEEIMKYVYMSDEPYDTLLAPHYQEYSAIRKSGIKVTVDGVGADELFGGYSFAVLDFIKNGNLSDKELVELVELYNDMVFLEDRITLDDVRKSASENTARNYSQYTDLDALNRILYVETHRNILPAILRVSDRYGMASGVEIRMPFLDYRVVSFAFSLPWTSKLRNGYSKAIVRDMAKAYMDSRILERKVKIGFNDPLTEWFRGPLKDILGDIVNSKDFIECELINSLQASVIINEFLKSEDNTYAAGYRIWPLIVPYLWEKAVIKQGCDYE